MKKTYLAPGMIMVQLQHKQHLLVDSVHTLSSNAGIDYGGAGDGDARTRESRSVWDEEW